MKKIKLLKSAIEKDPKFLLAYHCLAETLFNNNKYNESIETYNKIINIFPENYKAHYNLGLMLFDKGNIKQAKTELLKADKIQPKTRMFV